MGGIIRQSTAITVAIGPFLDATDAVTAETGLTLTQPDIRLSKNGGAFAQKSAAQTLSHMENGYYSLSLSTTDTNTVGRLRVHVAESGALPVWEDFQVVEEAVYDAFFAASAGMAVTLASGAVTAAAIATGAIDADAIAADAVTEIQNGLATAAALATVDGNVDSILEDTGTTLPATLATIDGNVDAILVDTGTTLDGKIDTIDTVVDAIKAKTDNLPTDPADQSLIIAATDQIRTDIAALNDLSTADILGATVTEGFSTAGSDPTLAQILHEIRQGTLEFSISGTTLTVKKQDGSTTAMTFTLDDDTNPTSRTRAT